VEREVTTALIDTAGDTGLYCACYAISIGFAFSNISSVTSALEDSPTPASTPMYVLSYTLASCPPCRNPNLNPTLETVTPTFSFNDTPRTISSNICIFPLPSSSALLTGSSHIVEDSKEEHKYMTEEETYASPSGSTKAARVLMRGLRERGREQEE
jgi:hypothetical protein